MSARPQTTTTTRDETMTTTYRYAVELENGSEVIADDWAELLAILHAVGHHDARAKLGAAPARDEWVTFDTEWIDGAGVRHSVYVEGIGDDYAAPDYSDDEPSAHGFDECPSCGGAGVKMTRDGYAPCARFRSCWSDSAGD